MKAERNLEKTVKLDLNNVDSVKHFASLSVNQDFDIDLISGKYVINGKSILGIFSLDLSNKINMKVTYSEDSREEVDKFLKAISGYTID